MNRPIRNVAIAVMVMVVVLLANATYVQVFKADELRSDTRNSRVLLDEYARQRGVIVAADGTVLAESVPTDNKFKYLRKYPTSPMAFAPVTGYFSFVYRADRGIEYAEDNVLNGNDDRLFTQRFMDMFSGRDPRGGNVVTTVNPALQRVAYNELRNAGCDGPCRGAVVAMEPSTGKILAMASTPSYDPNELASQDFADAEKAWESFNTPDGDEPMTNRAIDSLYPPGSTYKVVTTATALQAGLGPQTRLTAAPTITLPESSATLSNDSGSTCPGSVGGTVSLTQAFEYSCNTAFAQLMTEKMPGNPSEQFTATSMLFGVGENAPGIPMDVAKSTVGDIGDDLAALGQSAIGQRDVRVTVLENAEIAATVANGGVRMRPYLVEKLQTADLRTIATTSPSAFNRPLSAEQADQITEMMVRSEQNTANAQSGIASKTGTAEHSAGSRGGETPYAWYIAFSPNSNARIAVAVILENGNRGQSSYGGLAAAPIGRAVINAYAGGAR
ncbi:penicillin-binding transpeptidase domain-containing protein [Gordonia sp. (in: high G+C Gram-positive bacteria)]|uniref:penicillin-binding transpeptidase domain-containing protein n=1 Tax=Gordonia sp. (in: high G+C Gram-positive bacteria) TaxID=84139 RepID=UPI001695CB9E|nr:penicillin-binding protein 2 [Gordonia sp. (in: high G+C Gram-positive bacteria)]NLG47757.1 penicillin-binding protein 2 [Gordonia sp. (in: high G+C Gram-positive bacteria)]